MGEIFWSNGRNGRARYWLTAAIELIVLVVYCISIFSNEKTTFANNLFSFPSLCMIGAVTWVSVVNRIHRYHDLDKSGFWIFVAVIPIIGPTWQFVELGFRRGTDGGNTYGFGPYDTSLSGGTGSEFGKSGLAKVDDAYLEEYARRLHEQKAPQLSHAGASASTSQGGASFGKRR